MHSTLMPYNKPKTETIVLGLYEIDTDRKKKSSVCPVNKIV